MRIRRPQESTQLASVTVVIPCYNYGKYLPQVVQSVLSQERVDANIIIVDDASTDGSLDVAKSLVNIAAQQEEIQEESDSLREDIFQRSALIGGRKMELFGQQYADFFLAECELVTT